MCPHTAIYQCVCVCVGGVGVGVGVCVILPNTRIACDSNVKKKYVSAYCYTCVIILLNMCRHTAVYFLTLLCCMLLLYISY
jgi:hypothetical protein